ncbi:FecR domain-containing protein [Chlamydiota bacterium]
MKTIKYNSIIVCLCFIIIGATSIWGAQQSASVISWEGEVSILAFEEKTEKSPETGMVLYEGDTIRTGEGSHIIILIHKKDQIKIEENSELTISTVQESSSKARFLVMFKRPIQAKKTTLLLAKGKVLSEVSRMNSKSSFIIKTPRAIAGVRGTGFSVSDDGILTTVMCWLGRVFLSDLSEQLKVFIRKGQQASIKSGESPTKPTLIPSRTLKLLRNTFLSQALLNKNTQSSKVKQYDKKGKNLVYQDEDAQNTGISGANNRHVSNGNNIADTFTALKELERRKALEAAQKDDDQDVITRPDKPNRRDGYGWHSGDGTSDSLNQKTLQ